MIDGDIGLMVIQSRSLEERQLKQLIQRTIHTGSIIRIRGVLAECNTAVSHSNIRGAHGKGNAVLECQKVFQDPTT